MQTSSGADYRKIQVHLHPMQVPGISSIFIRPHAVPIIRQSSAYEFKQFRQGRGGPGVKQVKTRRLNHFSKGHCKFFHCYYHIIIILSFFTPSRPGWSCCGWCWTFGWWKLRARWTWWTCGGRKMVFARRRPRRREKEGWHQCYNFFESPISHLLWSPTWCHPLINQRLDFPLHLPPKLVVLQNINNPNK